MQSLSTSFIYLCVQIFSHNKNTTKIYYRLTTKIYSIIITTIHVMCSSTIDFTVRDGAMVHEAVHEAVYYSMLSTSYNTSVPMSIHISKLCVYRNNFLIGEGGILFVSGMVAMYLST